MRDRGGRQCSPVATERDVEHDLLRREKLGEVALRRDGEACGRCAPRRDVDRGRVFVQRIWDIRPLRAPSTLHWYACFTNGQKRVTHAPEPHIDARNIELRRPHASASRREACPEAVRLGLMHGASWVSRTVLEANLARLYDSIVRCASCGRVDSHLVVRHKIDTFQDIYRTSQAYASSEHPECPAVSTREAHRFRHHQAK